MSMLVKFDACEDYTTMAICHRQWRIGNIHVPTQAIIDFLTGKSPLDYHDVDDHVTWYTYAEKVIRIKVTHVVPHEDGTISGRQCNLYISKAKLVELIDNAEPFALLSEEPKDFPKIVFQSRHILRDVVNDRLKRRALSKRLRDDFKWHGAKEIRLYDYDQSSFLFEEIMNDGKTGLVGGLFLRETKYRKKYHKEYYSVLT